MIHDALCSFSLSLYQSTGTGLLQQLNQRRWNIYKDSKRTVLGSENELDEMSSNDIEMIFIRFEAGSIPKQHRTCWTLAL